MFTAGASVQWLRDEMKMLKTVDESEYVAQEVEDTDGVYMVPAFAGMGAPYWNQYVRGTIVGLTRGTSKRNLTGTDTRKQPCPHCESSAGGDCFSDI